ncbi:carotenoid biosynthesis protein [Paenibacillus assamensis]|uniref:carotenoid biosynthesis protein n=1 Tax=Paenibacillus assamensis TaxID=311244 RepID=UPI0003FD2ED7|nr:carotenoid biosynthesis protein [Paenibacillus assamensis]
MIIRIVFISWLVIGLLLMMTIGVPDALAFSNGLFLLFFGWYAVSIERSIDGEMRLASAARLIVIAVVTFFIEWIGVVTGFPFGDYHYTPLFGFAIGGVPLAIACAWVGVVYTALLLSSGSNRWLRAVQVGGWTVLLDLVLDPVANAREFWIWHAQEGYFGVPYVNFVSWFFISGFMSLLFPLRSIPVPQFREGGRLMQMMLFMFGLLSVKEGLLLPSCIAFAGILFTEGVLRYAVRRTEQAVS